MAFEGPQLCYARDGEDREDPVAHALHLARQIEELLEDTPSSATPNAHGTRIARALAASLVDELQGVVRGTTRNASIA